MTRGIKHSIIASFGAAALVCGVLSVALFCGAFGAGKALAIGPMNVSAATALNAPSIPPNITASYTDDYMLKAANKSVNLGLATNYNSSGFLKFDTEYGGYSVYSRVVSWNIERTAWVVGTISFGKVSGTTTAQPFTNISMTYQENAAEETIPTPVTGDAFQTTSGYTTRDNFTARIQFRNEGVYVVTLSSRSGSTEYETKFKFVVIDRPPQVRPYFSTVWQGNEAVDVVAAENLSLFSGNIQDREAYRLEVRQPNDEPGFAVADLTIAPINQSGALAIDKDAKFRRFMAIEYAQDDVGAYIKITKKPGLAAENDTYQITFKVTWSEYDTLSTSGLAIKSAFNYAHVRTTIKITDAPKPAPFPVWVLVGGLLAVCALGGGWFGINRLIERMHLKKRSPGVNGARTIADHGKKPGFGAKISNFFGPKTQTPPTQPTPPQYE